MKLLLTKFGFKKLLNVGVSQHLSIDSSVRVQMSNLMAFLAILANIQYSILSWFFDAPGKETIVTINIIFALLISVSYLLNLNARYMTAKIYLMMVIPLPVFFATWFYLGPEPGTHYFFLVFAMMPFVAFSYNHRYIIFAFFIINMFVYLYFEFFALPKDLSGSDFYSAAATELLRFMSIVSCIFHIALIMIYFLRIVYLNQEELIRNNIHKDRIFSILAHDLKGPIGIMSTYLTVLIDTNQNDKNLVFGLKELRKNATQGFLVLENLLDWVRTDSGKIIFSPEKINISDIVLNIRDLLSIQASEKQIVWEIQIPEDCYEVCDERMTSTIFRNIISNAIKYSPYKGMIKIFYEKQTNHWSLIIEDFGIGMDTDRLQQIVSREKLVSIYGTAGEKGTGLGLVVSLDLIREQGGNFILQSEKGIGTKFTIQLPNRN
ncbi:HAMP domain-containing sensor histidine kinase [Leptospira sp. 96542]|nr:HAMP domain-containing sensor histidine kinase [Leptospira sp. 96542]